MGSMYQRRYRDIELREWLYDKDDQADRARLLKTLSFPEKFREEKSYSTIKDIKEY